MLANRRNAYAIIQKRGVVDLVNWRSDPSSPITGEEADLVWSVLVYYERLWILIKNQQIANKAALDAYGDNFYWWWEICFRHVEVREGEATVRHLHRLKEWMDRRVIAEARNREQRSWTADGLKDWAAIQRGLQARTNESDD